MRMSVLPLLNVSAEDLHAWVVGTKRLRADFVYVMFYFTYVSLLRYAGTHSLVNSMALNSVLRIQPMMLLSGYKRRGAVLINISPLICSSLFLSLFVLLQGMETRPCVHRLTKSVIYLTSWSRSGCTTIRSTAVWHHNVAAESKRSKYPQISQRRSDEILYYN